VNKPFSLKGRRVGMRVVSPSFEIGALEAETPLALFR
jgi:hypothetical protein